MKGDIKDRKDIELLVNTFYEKIKTDKSIGPFFAETTNINLIKHLSVMYDFWDNILFFTGNYDGNPLSLHHHLNKITTIKKKHFNRWNKLFSATVNELFEGEKATLIKAKALSIAEIMQKNMFTK
ncbi:MAG TPA: group III truncated hemoglobin [Chitinophagales bacterium]|jgi:hemoglobin|nr:group III truncated hemoglobin [Chitinophagales bacterium]HOY41108.1 group III truncated hemoglobin [Chitinophagales bacterium]